MKSNEEEIYKQLHESQAKYTYFLLAGAASAIALAVSDTRDCHISWTMLPLGLSVLSWGVSFFAGCRNRQYFHSTLYANFNLILAEEGRHPQIPEHPQIVAAAAEGITKAAEVNSTTANKWTALQFRLLVSEGVFYLAWHITRMCIN
jgi:hypothetical protein